MVSGINVLYRGPFLNKKLALVIENQDVGGAMGQPVGAHARTRNGTDDTVFFIDDGDDLFL
jgi:hypothetical protein